MEAVNILREDLPLPVCVLRASALERNLAEFQRFSEAAGVLLCPHAKTTMAPALFRRQLAAGSWGLTFATGPQVRAAREHGVPFELSDVVSRTHQRALRRFGPKDGELLAVALLEEQAGTPLRYTT